MRILRFPFVLSMLLGLVSCNSNPMFGPVITPTSIVVQPEESEPSQVKTNEEENPVSQVDEITKDPPKTLNQKKEEKKSTTSNPPKLSLEGKHLLFSVGFRTKQNYQYNVLAYMGHYDFYPDGRGSIRFFEYNALVNSPNGITTTQRMPLEAPYRKNCQEGKFRIPSYQTYRKDEMRWSVDGVILKIHWRGWIHKWRLEMNQNGYFTLNAPFYVAQTGIPGANGVRYDKFIGMAYLSSTANLKNRLGPSALGSYTGELYQMIADRKFRNTGNAGWKRYTTSLGGTLFKSRENSNLSAYSYACPLRNAPEMYCQSSFLFNYAPYSTQLIYFNGGHDFNSDGCYNEIGHRIVFYTVPSGGKIARMVFLEYSYETDGFPIISVGRYY